MQKIPFIKKIITCILAALVMGACMFRQGVTFFRTWIPIGILSMVPLLCIISAVIYLIIWQSRKTNNPATLAFLQGLIRFGVAFDLASFGWEKIFHLQLVMPQSKLELPYGSFTPSDLFWTFFSHSYLFGCIIAGFQIVGALLLLFRRTRLLGVFVLLPILTNILLMDIFYQIGASVVVHTSIMMLGTLYFLFIEFDRLKQFFFFAKDQLPAVTLSKYFKIAIRLSIIYIPLLLIAMHGNPDMHPQLTGKYEVKQLRMNQQTLYRVGCGDSILTVIYFDIRNICVFEFNTPQNRWNGGYTLKDNRLEISWYSPENKPVFRGVMSQDNGFSTLKLKGVLGSDSMNIIMQKLGN